MDNYTFGVEEEFFVSHARTLLPAKNMTKKLARSLLKTKYGSVSAEMLQNQIEISTDVCRFPEEARAELIDLRRRLRDTAGEHDHVISASGTHPIALWHEQSLTRKARYRQMQDDLQIVGRRNVVCGMHVHVAVPQPERRIGIMVRALPFLPLLMAFTLSSPFWQGHLTGLQGYRLSAYDELPRTGFPPLFASTQAYDDYVEALVAARIIPDSSHIWWCLRPARDYPTLELRINDSTPRIDDVMCAVAWFRCLIKRLGEDKRFGYTPTPEMLAIVQENRWRVQRFGVHATLVDPQTFESTSLTMELERLAEALGQDADELQCTQDFNHWRRIVAAGTAADRQIEVYDLARARGRSRHDRLRDVMTWLIDETAANYGLAQPIADTWFRDGASNSRRGAASATTAELAIAVDSSEVTSKITLSDQ